MIREYEGKTEKEAIAKAISDLGLNQEEFDVEIMEAIQRGLFKKGSVKIRVHIDDKLVRTAIEPQDDQIREGLEFLTELVLKMGFEATVSVLESDEENKIIFDIQSEESSILIGKKGKNLDAIQLLVNIFINTKYPDYSGKVVIDIENYRNRREDYLIRLANRTANIVARSRSSKLLEPLNPFERRLIHTTLNNRKDVFTKSEGEGHFKRVRIFYKGDGDRGH
jgi:spoIIIJ-associated protein